MKIMFWKKPGEKMPTDSKSAANFMGKLLHDSRNEKKEAERMAKREKRKNLRQIKNVITELRWFAGTAKMAESIKDDDGYAKSMAILVDEAKRIYELCNHGQGIGGAEAGLDADRIRMPFSALIRDYDDKTVRDMAAYFDSKLGIWSAYVNYEPVFNERKKKWSVDDGPLPTRLLNNFHEVKLAYLKAQLLANFGGLACLDL
jgi:hypothetical protein